MLITTVGDKLSVLAGFIANLTLTDSVNIDLCGWYSSNITCLFLLVRSRLRNFCPKAILEILGKIGVREVVEL